MSEKKKLSGSQFKKKRLSRINEQKKMSFSLQKFLLPSTSASSHCSADSDTNISGESEVVENEIGFGLPEEDEITKRDSDSDTDQDEDIQDDQIIPDYSDPVTWRNVSSLIRQIIIEKGPFQLRGIDFPKDSNGRHFSESFYDRSLANGEVVQRKWLVYSKINDALFCFCCYFFITGTSSAFSNVQGFCDWRNASRNLKLHEVSKHHMECYNKWMELDLRLKSDRTIDSEYQKRLDIERQRWRNILKRVIAAIKLCAVQNLALRGNSDKIFVPNNGNFLKILEFLSEFDNIIKEHLEMHSINKGKVNYLGKNIQNEIIFLLAQKVRSYIVSKIKESKYYSIILDCTPDTSRIEQMSLVIRCCIELNAEYSVKEYFINFLPVEKSTGAALTQVLLDTLDSLELKIENIRGQGYDNGANMKGINSGVQRHILNLNPKAFFVPCACHSLNLVVNDGASKSGQVVNFFGLVQELFVFFSNSTSRWDVLHKHVKSLNLKSVCTTRWSSRIDAIKPLRYQLEQVYDALVAISLDTTRDHESREKSKALANKVSTYDFICSVVLWYDVLSKVAISSKMFQNPTLDISVCTTLLGDLTAFLEEYRKNGFTQMLCAAKEIATELEVEPTFEKTKAVRVRKKSKLFSYEHCDEPIVNAQKKFEIEFFNCILDVTINSVKERFLQLNSHRDLFGFLYDISSLKEVDSDTILKNCKDLHTLLTDDIEPLSLYTELLVLKNIVKKPSCSPLDVLNFITKNNLKDNFPNVSICLRILLTIPVSVASGERSFSKLKLIKNFLRSTMTQERLGSLGILSIEYSIVQNLDFDDLVDEFAKQKVRKVAF